jgi:hypothetical protein
MVNITPEQYADLIHTTPRYEAVECNDGFWGVRDNVTDALMSDSTGHIIFKFEHNARLMARVVNGRS